MSGKDAPAVRTLALEEITVDHDLQQRVNGIHPTTINEYTAALEDGKDLGPVDVFESREGIYLADGFHRYEAHQSLGAASIDCRVHRGTRKDALVFACGANSAHGMRRSNDDKRKAVRTLLELFPKRSDRWIAERAAVDHVTVGRVKTEVVNFTTSQKGGTRPAPAPDDDEPADDGDGLDAATGFPPVLTVAEETVIGKDGKTYPARKPKDKPQYPLSDGFCKMLSDIVAMLNAFRSDYGGLPNLLTHEKWDPDETVYVKQMIASLAKTFTDMNKELKKDAEA